MNRREFIQAFSAGTTLAAATSLASITEASPVIRQLEQSLILPGDKIMDCDWVFDYVGYFSHQYELVNEWSIGTRVPNHFPAVLESVKGDMLLFSFELDKDYFKRYRRPFYAPERLPEHVELFLASHVFRARKSDFELEATHGDNLVSSLLITKAAVAREV